MNCYAYSLCGRLETGWETLSRHHVTVNRRAGGFAGPFGAPAMNLATKLLHDVGKCALPYRHCPRQPQGAALRGPDFTAVGAKEVIRAFGGLFDPLMAFGVDKHHGGLMDGDVLQCRLDKAVDDYSGWRSY